MQIMRRPELFLIPALLLGACRPIQPKESQSDLISPIHQTTEYIPTSTIYGQTPEPEIIFENVTDENKPNPNPQFLRRHPKLCARIEEIGDSALATEMRMQYIRAYMPISWIGDTESPQEKALNEAVEQGMTPIFVFAPTEKIDNHLMQEKLNYILTKFPTTIIEILNEWDNEKHEFWKDRNPDTAAQFTAETIQYLSTSYPDIRVILGATVDPNNLEQMLNRLKNVHNINLSNLLIAGHAYNNEADITETGRITHEIMSRYGIPTGHYILTELGVNQENQYNLPYLTDLALNGENSASGVCLHTIRVHPSSGPEEQSFELLPVTRSAIAIYADTHIQP